MSIQCPKCKKINPKINTSSNTHYSEQCKTIVGTKTILFGLLTIPLKCNHFLVFDEDDDYIIINKNIVKPINYLNND